MARIINTANLPPHMNETEKLHVYNGLDCGVTLEVFNVLRTYLDNTTSLTYQFAKELQAPILEMNMRGVLVDQEYRAEAITSYRRDLVQLKEQLYRIVSEVFDIDTSDTGSKAKPTQWWRSNQKLMHLFYTVMGLPSVKKRNPKGEYVPTINREALEKLKVYTHAEPLINHLLAMRDAGKKIGVLETAIDPDSRIRTSYNIAGTDTGRLSSRMSDFGTGTNLQNIEQRLRRIFVSDPNYKFANIDLSQADARGVAGILWNQFSDESYLNACESGDLHTTVCRLAWTELPWTGDIKKDREIADQPAYRHLSYRDLAKRLGHGTNYMGQPATMAKHTKLERQLIEEFQRRYFSAFPNIRKWHDWVRTKVWTEGYITTLLGRKRWFFGRRDDDATIRAAVAYEPQSVTADAIDRGLLAVWRDGRCQVLLQVHDSILLQYPQHLESTLVPHAISLIEAPIELNGGRKLIIPAEAMCGWNWSYHHPESNPDGLKKYAGNDTRRRTRQPKANQLDYILSGVY